MKISFINPPFLPKFSRGQRSPGVTKGGTLYYPYWLAYAAGWAEKQGFEVELLDAVAANLSADQTLQRIKEFDPQLVVLETSTPSILSDVSFADAVKRVLPRSFTLLVGTHPSALPEETLKLSQNIDAVAVGEYDQTVVELARAIESRSDTKKVPGLFQSPRREYLSDLDQLPFVSEVYKKYLDIRDYYFAAADYPMVMIITGRGCPFGCHFCLWPQTLHGFKYRLRSPQNVVLEFDWIEKNLPEVKEVVIEDDTFTADVSRVREICKLLIENKNRLKWSTNVRVTLDLETMGLMKKGGCRLLIVGYESGSQKVLDAMGKKIKLEESLKFAENAKKADLLVHGCFMVGNPGETKETMWETLEFAKKLNPDSAQFYPLFVYPGTKAFSWAKEKGFLKTKDFSEWLKTSGKHRCVIDLPNLSAEEMTRFCERAYLLYHLRPRYLLEKFFQLIRNPTEGKRSIRGAINILRSARPVLAERTGLSQGV